MSHTINIVVISEIIKFHLRLTNKIFQRTRKMIMDDL